MQCSRVSSRVDSFCPSIFVSVAEDVVVSQAALDQKLITELERRKSEGDQLKVEERRSHCGSHALTPEIKFNPVLKAP